MPHTASIFIKSSSPSRDSNNRISNTKCSLISFPFKMIMMQFENISSIFFFIIIVIQLNPKYSVTSVYASIVPWMVIFLANVLREGKENYCRYLRDKEINLALYKKLGGKEYTYVESQNIKAGDIIMIEKGQRVPADCVLLKSEDLTGEIFIRTDQLDGETDWKRRNSHPETQLCSVESITDIEAEIEAPSKNIYSFNGRLLIKNFVKSIDDNLFLFNKSDEYYAKQKFNFSESSAMNTPSMAISIKEEDKLGETNIIKTSNIDDNELSRNDEEVDKINQKYNEKVDLARDGEQISFNSPIGEKSVDLSEYYNDNSQTTQREMPLDLENTLWANTVLSSSDALCLVIYTGHDTRSMMNTLKPRNKIGIIDRELDWFITILAVLSFAGAFIFAYLRVKSLELEPWIITFVRYVIIFSYVIPISLKFMMTTARYIYVWRLQSDSVLKTVKVMTNTLQEELARISFFLTDKTGTLTKNEMLMRKLHIGTICYNADSKADIIRSLRKVLDKAGLIKPMFWKKSKSLDTKIYELVEALCICNSVNPIESEEGLTYQASSPDEIAMVNYAMEVGFQMIRRDNGKIVIKDLRGEESEYKIFYVFPFNSDTKRMGIIVMKDNEYVFYEKGADTVMKSIIQENDWVEEETDNMAREGLRTLVFAKKVITKAEFNKFSKAYEKAKKSLVDRNELMLSVQCNLEKDLAVIGITGVEDKLQDRVRQTLECIRNAGVKIWMLTGDKIETAISIAFSSRLLTKNDQYTVIAKCSTKEEVDKYLTHLSIGGFNALVIDGQSLALIIDHFLDRFIDIAKDLHCLIGCRYSPTQKALMASKLRIKAKETVLCIGDGGNDVSMITSADVGVGIEGKEGSQASLAADFSLKCFSDISDLMFYHGRRCYKNSSKMAHIIFHRGIIISTIQAIFCALIHFFPISILQGIKPSLFILFTIPPLFWIIYDQDISKEMAIKYPELYKELRDNKLLSKREFFSTLTVSVFQSSVFILLYHLKNKEYEIFNMSILCFTNLVINEQLMVILCVWENLNYILLLICFFSMTVYIIATRFIEELYTIVEVFEIGLYLLLINLIAISPKLLMTIYCIYVKPASHIKLRSNNK